MLVRARSKDQRRLCAGTRALVSGFVGGGGMIGITDIAKLLTLLRMQIVKHMGLGDKFWGVASSETVLENFMCEWEKG